MWTSNKVKSNKKVKSLINNKKSNIKYKVKSIRTFKCIINS